MGCRGSKAEHPLVSRCRERRELIRAAADHRYALAAAHAAYFRSLKNLGDALQSFVDEELITDQCSASSPSSSHVSRKCMSSNEPPLLNPSCSYVDDGSNSEGDFNLSHRRGFAPDLVTGGGFRVSVDGYDSLNGSFVNTPPSYGYDSDYNYANAYRLKKSAPAARTVVPPPPTYGYSGSYWNYSDDYAGDYGLFRNYSTARVRVSPKHEWAWDFFNPFAVLDDGFPGYDPTATHGYGSSSTSPDLSEVRKREGIPDLEDETESEGCKEDLRVKREKAEAKQSSRERSLGSREQLTEKPWSPLQYNEESLNQPFRDLREVVAEIRNDFETASGYGKEVESMLEVDKLPYRPSFLEVILSRMLHLIVPCLKFTGFLTRMERSCFEDVGEGANASVCELSSTLDKLYVWETKLFKEVEHEERLRAKYEKEYKWLRILDEEGAEPSKIYAAQASIRRLRTKLSISIRAIDAISSTIHKSRDDELLPRVAQLIHGLINMWRAMLKCHQKQFQAVMELKTRNLKLKPGRESVTGPRPTTKELEKELLLWSRHFKDWIGFQKSYAESLNGWLLKSIQYDTKELVLKPGFCSPGQPEEAPPIFIICNEWQKALACISEVEVGKAMDGLSTSLKLLLGKQDDEGKPIRARLGKGNMEAERDSGLDKKGVRDGLGRVFRVLEEFSGEAFESSCII